MICCDDASLEIVGSLDEVLLKLLEIEHSIYKQLLDNYTEQEASLIISEFARFACQDNEPIDVLSEEMKYIQNYGILS